MFFQDAFYGLAALVFLPQFLIDDTLESIDKIFNVIK